MFKKACIRATGGFAYSVLSGQLVAILISLSIGDGKFYLFTPEFRASFATDLQAVIVQTLLTGLIGTVFAATSIVFEIENWSVLKQCAIHFLITSCFWIPIVNFCWPPQDPRGVLIWFISFFGTYLTIWLIQYLISRSDVRKIKAKLQAVNDQLA